ncbi:pancreatic triacylglycerol lipase-like isoform X1 [Hetaerina americana]|uniref:pancreatic triacylglycerol lipase-like isoform X1 n=1 Tax=Hetaerina americana TaxID=62018 RepID=UPI003A7F6020
MEPAALALVAATFLFITGAPCVMSLQLPTMPIPTALTNLASVNGSNITLPDIMYFPDDRGEPKPGRINGWALAEPVKESDVFFKLYTRAGPEEGEVIPRGDADALRNSTFNASAPTRVVIHGFIQSSESNTVQAIKDAYIANLDGNVIAVDWSKISRNWLYFVVKAQADQVGGLIAAFVEFLVRVAGVDVSDVHLSGYSLGAHVAGIAGKNIRVLVGKKAGRITGLDPAGPLYSVLDRGSRLDRADANFVDVIHTCGGWLGMGDPIGHVDFYPNGGVLRQPGCSWDIGGHSTMHCTLQTARWHLLARPLLGVLRRVHPRKSLLLWGLRHLRGLPPRQLQRIAQGAHGTDRAPQHQRKLLPQDSGNATVRNGVKFRGLNNRNFLHI